MEKEKRPRNKNGTYKKFLSVQERTEHYRKYQRNWKRNLRKEVLFHYGTSCECCGETHYEFLTIDHIEGGGTKHRKSLGGGRNGGTVFYSWLKKNKFPKGFRVLCYNCNCALGHYDRCPHKKTA